MAEPRVAAQIKIFEAKKQTLFQRIQRLYDWSKNLKDANNEHNFKTMYHTLDDTRNQIYEVVEKINLLNMELNPDEYKPNFQVLDAVDQLYCPIQVAAKTVLVEPSVSHIPGASSSTNVNGVLAKAMPKLPKIEIKEFSGDSKCWPIFYGMYTSLVHNNPELDDTCKIHYLLSRLTGRALALCSGIPPVGENYSIIWKILVDKYQDKRSLASNYLKQILEFKPLQLESSNNLNIFLERFDTSVNALKKLEIPDLTDFLLTYIALSKLDSQTQRQFEISTKDTPMPTYSTLADFVKQQTKILSRTTINSNFSKIPQNSCNNNNRPKVTHSFVNTNSKIDNCPVCKQTSHLVTKCQNFLKLTPPDRYKIAKEKYLCLNCLSNKHRIADCKSLNACSICKIRHHSLLHFNREPRTTNNSSSITIPSSSANYTGESPELEQPTVNNETIVSLCSTANIESSPEQYTTLLSTAVVKIKSFNGEFKPIRVLLDSASQANFLSLKCCRKLQLPISKINSSVIGIGNSSKPIKGQIHNVTIFSRFNNNTKFNFDALVIEKITDSLPTAAIKTQALSYLMDLPLADAEFYKSSEVDGILGAQLFPQLVGVGKVTGTPDLPIALQTLLGYVVMGKAPVISFVEKTHSFCSIVEPPLEKIMQQFLEIENIPNYQLGDPDDKECEEHFRSTYKRDVTGRYTVCLPFKNSASLLGDSYSIALRRLLSLEKKLNTDINLRQQYNDVIQDYLDQGHMRKLVSEMDSTLPAYYIPHHPVFKLDSSSTPLRIVFDASAKTNTSVSLNDVLYRGPKLQTDVLATFLNFRLYPVAFTADIRQMYRQVNVFETHRSFQRLLWRFSSSNPVEIYEITTLVFGIKSSPYLALRVIQQLALDEGRKYPQAAEVVLRDMYIDDLICSVPSVDKAKILYKQLVNLFKAGGFSLVKWCVNSKALLNYIPKEKLSSKIVNFETDCLKVLGMQWHPNLDTLFFKVNIQSRECTKRNILSTVARLFDPLGLVAPVTLYAKLLVKKLWSLRCDWDECPPDSLREQWSRFQLELPLLETFSIPRHIGFFENTTAMLVGFADACESSYGSLVYLRTKTETGAFCTNLISAKSKVSPLKVVSVPRLELCAAVLLSKLIKFVIETYRSRYIFTKIYAFSDSTVVLHWINSSPHRWKTFVANRVAQIHSCLPTAVWFHVDGKENPSDCLSRGMIPSRFIENSKRWLAGPSWLSLDEKYWPIKSLENLTPNLEPLEEKTIALPVVLEEPNPLYSLISRYSSWLKLLRTMVIILKFVKILPRRKEILTTDLTMAENILIRVVQQMHFKNDICAVEQSKTCSPQLKKLYPFLDNNILRVGGRLSHSSLVYDHQHPILLPKKDNFVNLLIDYYHRLYLHTGPHILLSLLRQKYWILSARGIIRQRISLCNFCFKFKPKPSYPLMANLPPARVISQVKPFIETGSDFAGPYYITLSRNRGIKTQKAYVCLFVCLTTKCLHLELASDLSTATFLAAFQRFLSRRGPIKVLHTDCGTNYIGAKAQLDGFYNFIKSEYSNSLKEELLKNKIEWKFNTPSAPHMGGIWESNIKSVKTHIHKILGSQILSYEEFSTVLTQVEALLNSRPLCWLSSDPSEPEVLTPAHFLTLTPLKTLTSIDVVSEPLNRLDRKQLLDNLVQSYWKRWKNEYLSSLQLRQKWNSPSCPVQIGTLVILLQDNVPPLHWPLGVIEAVYPGPDGIIRTALVKTKNGHYKRPVVKLCPLPTQ